MKKILTILAVIATMTACVNSNNAPTTTTADSIAVVTDTTKAVNDSVVTVLTDSAFVK